MATVTKSSPLTPAATTAGTATLKELGAKMSHVRDPELLQRCLRICNMYKLSASELDDEWSFLQMNRGLKRLTPESLASLETSARDAYMQKKAKTVRPPRGPVASPAMHRRW